jgi:F420-dependent oxidoreductase-like protein
MRHPIRFGIQTAQQNVEWQSLRELWKNADAWGYDSLWAFDHFYPIFTDPEGPCFEGWTLLAALARETTRARIGHLVTGNTYRHPALLAKMAATVDHVSGGRLNLGIGAGWFELEHKSLGFDFKTVPARLQALDEACRIIKGMFTEKKTTFRGKHYTVEDAMGNPMPLHRPPIMIGGTGKKVLLRIVAEHADMWNGSDSAEVMGDLIRVIDQHGETLGRDTREIEHSVAMPFCYGAPKERQDFMCQVVAHMRSVSPSSPRTITPEQARAEMLIGDEQECLDTIARYHQIGVTHFILMAFPPYFPDELQGFAEDVIPAARRT